MAEFDITAPDGRKFRVTAPEGATQDQVLSYAKQNWDRRQQVRQQIENDPISQGAKNFNKDASFTDNLLAGAGKAVSDIGLGVKQIFGQASQQEVDEAAKRDAPLMNTGGGVVGNVGTQVGTALLPGGAAVRAGMIAKSPALAAAGRYALSAPATAGGAATQAGIGAVQAGLQPVTSNESRGTNMLIGAAGGAAVPVVGMGFNAAKAAVEPLYQGGRDVIVGRAMREAGGQNVNQIVQALSNATPKIPGSLPTAAEVANSGGIAAMQRAASAVDPEAYAARAAQQNEARVAALDGLTGSAGARESAVQAREQGAGTLYKQARASGIDPEVAKMMQPQVGNLLERAPHGVMERAKEIARVKGETVGKDGSVDGLHWIKQGVDDLIKDAKPGSPMESALVQYKKDLLLTIEQLSPLYEQGRKSFQQLSRPINQMDVAQTIADKSINKLTGQIQPQAFARALSDDTAAAATGFGKATLENTMEPGQLSILNALKGDLAGSVAARDLGRGAGSDTIQKLAMTNLMQRAGVPVGLTNLPGVGRVGNFAYQAADEKMKQRLAKALLNPQEAAQLMQGAVPSELAEKIALALRAGGAPLAIGSTVGLNGQ